MLSVLYAHAYAAQFIASLHGRLEADPETQEQCHREAAAAATMAVTTYSRLGVSVVDPPDHTPYGEQA